MSENKYINQLIEATKETIKQRQDIGFLDSKIQEVEDKTYLEIKDNASNERTRDILLREKLRTNIEYNELTKKRIEAKEKLELSLLNQDVAKKEFSLYKLDIMQKIGKVVDE
jgi:hypothetical protein